MIILGAITFIFSLYAFVLSKVVMPFTGNKILDWVKRDEYYICLMPSLLVTGTIFVYFNWLSMKYFRHG